ncbi:MAG: ABC transporter permease [Reichenbachiella sp.]
MLRNYFVTALRMLKKGKVYTLINVTGLALGIGCALVIFKVIRYETSFDKHHENYDEIYRVNTLDIYPDRTDKSMGTPHPLGPALKMDFPDIKQVTRTHYTGEAQINIQDENDDLNKFFLEDGVAFVQNNFFKMFAVTWIAGDPATALNEPNSVVVSSTEARKFFGLKKGEESNAMGQIVHLKNDFKVVGVIEDFPSNTSFPFTILFDYDGQKYSNDYYRDGKEWNSASSSTNTYILAESGFDTQGFDKKLVPFVKKYYTEDENKRFVTQPISDIHYNQEYDAYGSSVTSISLMYALAMIGLLLILTACINFINLATAQAANRAKEIGIRKAIGGSKRQLLTQFLLEISLITFISVVVSLMFSELLLIALEDIIGYRLTLDLLNNPMSILFLLILFVLVSAISGFYPAVLLSQMNATLALKSKISTQHAGGLSLRKGLVILQFVISQFLIVGTLVITAQMEYFNTKELGFETVAIINSYLPEKDEIKTKRFRTLMMQAPSITDVSFMYSQPTGNNSATSGFNYAPLASEIDYEATFKSCDPYYFDFFGLKILAGRPLIKTDSFEIIVINRKIADLMGFSEDYEGVIGKTLKTGWGGDKKIVGVVDNFHTYSLQEEIEYTILLMHPQIFYSLSFKSASMDVIDPAIAHFKESWDKVYPEYVIDYSFLDEELLENYETEKSMADLLRIFSLISIFIGCMGLYGLISFIAINKTKEIAVRKVLGASITSILIIFSKEIVSLTFIALFIATPIAYYVMNLWLEEYAYRITLGYEYFLLSFLITLVIALITIGQRAISTALINPADTLKDE